MVGKVIDTTKERSLFYEGDICPDCETFIRRKKNNQCFCCERLLKKIVYENRSRLRSRKKSVLYRQKRFVKSRWLGAKGRAKRHGLDFDIEPEDILIPEFCPVLGIKLKTEIGTGSSIEARETAPSLDRIDNNKGYTKDNILVVSNRANRLKSNATPEELIRIGEFYKNLQRSP